MSELERVLLHGLLFAVERAYAAAPLGSLTETLAFHAGWQLAVFIEGPDAALFTGGLSRVWSDGRCSIVYSDRQSRLMDDL